MVRYSFSLLSFPCCQAVFDIALLSGIAEAGGDCENGPEIARRSRRLLPGLMHKTLFHHGLRSSIPLHHHRHGLVIVPLHLEIGHPAVPLSRFDPGMPQEILDGHQGSVGIEEPGSHGMPQLVA